MIEQSEFFSIDSPCKRICQMNNRGYCIGCFRNRNERLHWNSYSDFQKQLIINLCEKRHKRLLEAKNEKIAAEHSRIKEAQLNLFAEAPPDQQELF